MAQPILQIDGLVKRFGGVAATDNVTLDITEGEVHGLIGPNGAGKTTLISQLAGEKRQDAGAIRFAGVDVSALGVAPRVRLGLARSFQITELLSSLTVEDNVALAIQARSGHSYRFWSDARQERSVRDPARELLSEVMLDRRASSRAGNLSHGEQRQLELAMALGTAPRMLLLDEPMAGMGIEESQRMLELLRRLKRRITMLLVEHDMHTVFALSDRVSVLVYGRLIACGAPDEIRASPSVRAAYLGEGTG
jgi:branched-chain amino acid transport system ATP-binding protein